MKIVHLCLVCITCEHRPVFSVCFNFPPSHQCEISLQEIFQPDILGTKKKKRIRFKWWKFNRSQKACQGLLSERNPQVKIDKTPMKFILFKFWHRFIHSIPISIKNAFKHVHQIFIRNHNSHWGFWLPHNNLIRKNMERR